MAYDFGPRILSRPLRVIWAGWETTTSGLQKAGWKLSACQDIRGSRIQLALKHSGMRIEGITQVIDYRYEDVIDLRFGREYLESIVLKVEGMLGDQVMVQHVGEISELWAPIDAEPRYTQNKITRLEDLAHFAGPLIRTNEIIVPEETVPELLEKILKMQQPARMDRIKEELRGERRREQHFHAQIISMRDVA